MVTIDKFSSVKIIKVRNNKKHSLQQCIYFMSGFGLNMNILVSNINRCGQKDLSIEGRHKAYASSYVALKTKNSDTYTIKYE